MEQLFQAIGVFVGFVMIFYALQFMVELVCQLIQFTLACLFVFILAYAFVYVITTL